MIEIRFHPILYQIPVSSQGGIMPLSDSMPIPTAATIPVSNHSSDLGPQHFT